MRRLAPGVGVTLFTQIARFVGVGLLATLMHVLVAICAAAWLGFPPLGANFTGFAAAVILSYLGQGRFTFGARLQHRFHAPRFLTIAVLGLALSTLITEVAVMRAGLTFTYAMGLVGVAVPLTTFTLCRFWLFKPSYGTGP